MSITATKIWFFEKPKAKSVLVYIRAWIIFHSSLYNILRVWQSTGKVYSSLATIVPFLNLLRLISCYKSISNKQSICQRRAKAGFPFWIKHHDTLELLSDKILY